MPGAGYRDGVKTADPLPGIDDPRRLVRLDAVHNFRDLGGYPTVDGRTTRWGLVYRADGLYRLTDTDLDVVRRLGLRSVIDLRTFASSTSAARSPTTVTPCSSTTCR